jgi:DNA polymerase-3 subunit epsilon
MSLLLFYDTETSGIPDFKAPSESEHQPHIVQAAAAIVDSDSRQIVSSIDLIAEPNGWLIPDDVAAIHGITTERASRVGVPESTILVVLASMWQRCAKRIAHNESFDARILRIAMKRRPDLFDDAYVEMFRASPAYCTMRASTPIVRLPGNKWPKLTEAHQHFFGRSFDDAHSAMADVRACIAVYFAIQDMQRKAA